MWFNILLKGISLNSEDQKKCLELHKVIKVIDLPSKKDDIDKMRDEFANCLINLIPKEE